MFKSLGICRNKPEAPSQLSEWECFAQAFAGLAGFFLELVFRERAVWVAVCGKMNVFNENLKTRCQSNDVLIIRNREESMQPPNPSD